MNAPSDERLMRYFDGELDPAESREIETWLETSEQGRAMVLGFERVGSAVRAIGEDMGGGADGIADAVMARVGESNGQGARAPAGSNVRAFPAGGRRWMAAVPAVGLAVAAAAAIALYFRPAPPPSRAAASAELPPTSTEHVLPVSPAASEVVAENAESEPGASIESVDFGAAGGSIFMVPNGQSSEDSETPVVWLLDDAAPDEGRMAPL